MEQKKYPTRDGYCRTNVSTEDDFELTFKDEFFKHVIKTLDKTEGTNVDKIDFHTDLCWKSQLNMAPKKAALEQIANARKEVEQVRFRACKTK